MHSLAHVPLKNVPFHGDLNPMVPLDHTSVPPPPNGISMHLMYFGLYADPSDIGKMLTDRAVNTGISVYIQTLTTNVNIVGICS